MSKQSKWLPPTASPEERMTADLELIVSALHKITDGLSVCAGVLFMIFIALVLELVL